MSKRQLTDSLVDVRAFYNNCTCHRHDEIKCDVAVDWVRYYDYVWSEAEGYASSFYNEDRLTEEEFAAEVEGHGFSCVDDIKSKIISYAYEIVEWREDLEGDGE